MPWDVIGPTVKLTIDIRFNQHVAKLPFKYSYSCHYTNTAIYRARKEGWVFKGMFEEYVPNTVFCLVCFLFSENSLSVLTKVHFPIQRELGEIM